MLPTPPPHNQHPAEVMHETQTSAQETVAVLCVSKDRSRHKRTQLNVTFSKAMQEQTCPIMAAAIHDVTVDFLPASTTLFDKHPEFNQAVINECGHTFHALALMYHFLRNCMACPVCRRGATNTPLDIKSFARNATMK
eukprot:1018714-Rhodomonas_salina.2